ncbi:hypothetical protein TEA_006445 [Camellia sinensis var. sinensis]|uniref:Uncharacterized protein n=1 Tax=Camellia sinensis var. sinensis TaxID=542762 RepID=A0A4S4F1L9_CAMSN|nr:hypothetical protein TEA_006445 [Camellia sinensis var. sinensis]
MFDITVDLHHPNPPPSKPSRPSSSSSQHNSGSIRSGPNSGPVGSKKSSGPMTPLQPTGLITSGPLGSSVGRRSGQLDAAGSVGKAVYGSAVTNLSEEVKVGFRVSKPVMWVVAVVAVMGLMVGAFLMVALKKAVILVAVAGILAPLVVVVMWNFVWKKRGFLGFLRKYPDAELRGAIDGQLSLVAVFLLNHLSRGYQDVYMCPQNCKSTEDGVGNLQVPHTISSHGDVDMQRLNYIVKDNIDGLKAQMNCVTEGRIRGGLKGPQSPLNCKIPSLVVMVHLANAKWPSKNHEAFCMSFKWTHGANHQPPANQGYVIVPLAGLSISILYFYDKTLKLLVFCAQGLPNWKYVTDFYISDFQSGLRALVKAGYGAKAAAFVKPTTIVDITKENRDLSPSFLRWLADRSLSSDDRVMRLKEGYIKEGSTVSVMGVVRRQDNVLMIVPSSEPVSTGYIYIAFRLNFLLQLAMSKYLKVESDEKTSCNARSLFMLFQDLQIPRRGSKEFPFSEQLGNVIM